MGRTPFLIPLSGMFVGILTAYSLQGIFASYVFAALLVLGILLYLLSLYEAGLTLLFAAIGWGAAIVSLPSNSLPEGERIFSGQIISERRVRYGHAAILSIDSVDSRTTKPILTQAILTGIDHDFYPGRRVRFYGRMRPLPAEPVIPDMVDLSREQRRRGVVARVYVNIDTVYYATIQATGFKAAMRRANRSLARRLGSSDISSRTFSVTNAMLLGNSSAINADRREIYSASGLSHLLALSGTHVAIITVIIAMMLWPLRVARRNKSRYLLTILLLWLYAILTGMSPSVVRSVIMASVFLFGRVLEHPSVSMNSLLIAAFFILLFRPYDIFAVGFWLSFAAVAGIVIFYPLINRVDLRNHPWIYRLCSVPALSIAAMLPISVLTMTFFHSFPLLFLPANVVVAPLVPLVVGGSMVVLLFPNASPVSEALDFLVDLIEKIAGAFGSVSFSHIDNIYLPAVVTVLLFVSILLIGVSFHLKRRTIAVGATLIAAIAITFCAVHTPAFPRQEEFALREYGHDIIIRRNNGELTMTTTAKTVCDRKNLLFRYSFLLKDYMARRKIESLSLEETNRD